MYVYLPAWMSRHSSHHPRTPTLFTYMCTPEYMCTFPSQNECERKIPHGSAPCSNAAGMARLVEQLESFTLRTWSTSGVPWVKLDATLRNLTLRAGGGMEGLLRVSYQVTLLAFPDSEHCTLARNISFGARRSAWHVGYLGNSSVQSEPLRIPPALNRAICRKRVPHARAHGNGGSCFELIHLTGAKQLYTVGDANFPTMQHDSVAPRVDVGPLCPQNLEGNAIVLAQIVG